MVVIRVFAASCKGAKFRMSKRKASESVEKLSELRSPAKNVRVQGMLTQLSPMKTSRNGGTSYFRGSISDGDQNVAVYGYAPDVRRDLAEVGRGKRGLILEKCDVVEGREGKLEIYAKGGSVVKSTSKLFDVDFAESEEVKSAMLEEVKKMNVGSLLNVRGKVLEVEEEKKGGED